MTAFMGVVPARFRLPAAGMTELQGMESSSAAFHACFCLLGEGRETPLSSLELPACFPLLVDGTMELPSSSAAFHARCCLPVEAVLVGKQLLASYM